ncbi:photosynthetic NDH subunit of subcomplex B 3, chloroplastic [Prosopis cineraria]|uniref:photosynthetic NDH subunit of subcomplex B 3, chloroplastic n=1 Tax=Prosopis cineraria TaxID=364024 RepID=UPI0024102649|nr:photosynthetic NDH subunit of subcomplex B 3, chloroplastic [Prosopis cineraria]
MGLLSLQLSSHSLCSLSLSQNLKCTTKLNKSLNAFNSKRPSSVRTTIRAVGTVPGRESQDTEPAEPPSIGFAFVSSVLLPDGTPDVQYRTACGGQKLRNIMMDANIDLYGPYARPLLNCSGGGTCATCMVEIIEGKELLSPRTDKENEKLKRKPKNWRLACQTTVGQADSTGMLVVQQLPEWKGHEWKYEKLSLEEAEKLLSSYEAQ